MLSAQKLQLLKKKILVPKFFICLILSIFAATGVIMYGYQFSALLTSNKYIANPLGISCAAAAMIANVMLGTYSLLMMKAKKSEKINLIILATSLVGSVPYGFLCFFGYQKILTVTLNIALSIIVVVVNAGIGYTAIKSVVQSLNDYFGKKNLRHKLPMTEQIYRSIGIFIGIVISTTMYLATCHGLTDLLRHFHLDALVNINVGYYLAFISWIPVAALFANGNQTVANELYQNIRKFSQTLSATTTFSVLFILFCLLSGSAISSMMRDAYDNSKNIPQVFKMDIIKFTVDPYLLVIALISSAALNYFAISKLREYFSK